MGFERSARQHRVDPVETPTAAPRRPRPRLVVGAADDHLEREADRVAAGVVRRLAAADPGVPTVTRTSAGVRRSSAGDGAGGEVAPVLAARIERERGAGRPLDESIRREMEPAFGTDFSAVRVHDGGGSAALNEALHAEAFTIGNDIFFRGGVPSPSSDASRHLLAHELTHVVQQGGSAEGAGGVRRLQRSVASFGGTFDAVQYDAVHGAVEDGGQNVGAVMDLAFTPAPFVDGLVGLVQSGKALRSGASDIGASDAGKQARAQGPGDLDPGRFLDRSNRKENPIFGMENQTNELAPMSDAAGLSLTTDAAGRPADQRNRDAKEAGATVVPGTTSAVDPTRLSKDAGKVGRGDPVGGTTEPATLRDEPGRRRAFDATAGSGESIEMRFETAALGVSGPVQGAYLGSVEWGFIAPADSAVASPLPFRLVSRGVPSPAFMKSAELWNANKAINMGGGTTRLNLPVALTTHTTDATLDGLLDDPATPPDRLRAALSARISLLQSQIPTDIDTQIAALRSACANDRGAADVFQSAVDRLAQDWADLAARTKAADAAKGTAEADLKAAKATADAVNASLNVLTRRIGKGKGRLEAAKVDVTAKAAALDTAKSTAKDLGDQQSDKGREMSDAKKDPAFRTALDTYRDDLIRLQNQLSDTRSRQIEIEALRTKLTSLPAPAPVPVPAPPG